MEADFAGASQGFCAETAFVDRIHAVKIKAKAKTKFLTISDLSDKIKND
jgi:hypothetical protein